MQRTYSGGFMLVILVVATACGDAQESGSGGGEGAAGATTASATSSVTTSGAGGTGGEGGLSAGAGGGGEGGGGGSAQTGPDALIVEHFTGPPICHRMLHRVEATPDLGWIISGEVMANDATPNAPCNIVIGSTVVAATPYQEWSVSFVAKLDAAAVPVWVLTYPPNKSDPMVISDMAVDSLGSVYVSGRAYSSFVIGDFEITGGYLMKVDPNGDPVSVVGTASLSLPSGETRVGLDVNDTIYIGSKHEIAKLSPDGDDVVATATVGGDLLRGMAVDDAGRVFFAYPTSSFETTWDVALGKLEPGLSSAWFQVVGGANAQSGHGVAPDGAGGVYVVGTYGTSADLGGPVLSGVGGSTEPNGFLAHYDASGSHVWSRSIGHSVFGNCCRGPSIRGLPGGGLVVAGSADNGELDFGQGPLPLSGADTLFLAKILDSGEPQWARTFGPHARATDVAVGADGRIAVVGTISDSVNFGTGPLSPSGLGDSVIAIFPSE